MRALLISVGAALLIATVLHARNPDVMEQFKQATGFPNGRPGWVVDHKVPLCAGGPDTVVNMQWQIKALSYRKDAFERALCAAMKAQGLTMVKQ